MHYTKTTPKIVEDIYLLFERICQTRRSVEKDHPAGEVALMIHEGIMFGGVELRVTSAFAAMGPKLYFSQIHGNLEVKFLPNLMYFDPIESELVPKANEIAKEFQTAVKSYLRHVDKTSE